MCTHASLLYLYTDFAQKQVLVFFVGLDMFVAAVMKLLSLVANEQVLRAFLEQILIL